jgi:hypothetical protein
LIFLQDQVCFIIFTLTFEVYQGLPNVLDEFVEKIRHEFEENRVVGWPCFSPFTYAAKREAKNSAGARGIIFQISVSSGRRIGKYSVHRRKNSVLLPPNLSFRVVKGLHEVTSGEDAHFYWIHLQECGIRNIKTQQIVSFEQKISEVTEALTVRETREFIAKKTWVCRSGDSEGGEKEGRGRRKTAD